MASQMSQCPTTGHSTAPRPSDSCRSISFHTLQVQQGTLKRTVRSKERFARHAQEKWHLQCPLDLQVNSPKKWLLAQRTTYGTPPANATLQANLYPNVLTNDRQWVDEKEIGPINTTTLISDTEWRNYRHRNLDKILRSIRPCWRKNRETPILLCHYRKGHAPTKPLCLSGHIHISSDGTAQSYVNPWCYLWCVSSSHSSKASDYRGTTICLDSFARYYPRSHVRRVHQTAQSKP